MTVTSQGNAHTTGWGMYGFEVLGFASPADILCPVPPGWLGLTVVREEANGTLHRPTELAPGFMRFDESSAEVWLNDGERIELDRDSMQVRLTTREPVTDDALAHPYLGLPAAVASHWHGRQVLHGGSFLHHGAAWAVLGSKEGGKSSTLGWLRRRGVPVLSDDLVIVDGTIAFAGPRCIDLRDDAAEWLGGRDVGSLGGRRRWRLDAGDVPAQIPLAGVVHLAWADDIGLDRLQPGDRLVRLFEHVVCAPDEADARAYLDLAGLPAWEFARPRTFDRFEPAVDQLLEALS